MKAELIAQLRRYLSGGQTLKQFESWVVENTDKIKAEEDAVPLFNEVDCGLLDMRDGTIKEKQLRKAWQRMLNAKLYGG